MIILDLYHHLQDEIEYPEGEQDAEEYAAYVDGILDLESLLASCPAEESDDAAIFYEVAA